MKKHLHRCVAVMLACISIAFAGTPAAAADTPPVTILDSICYVYQVCMFEDDNYYGDKYVFSATEAGNREIGGWDGDNEISSLKNRSFFWVCLYEDDGQGGDHARIPPGAYVPSLGAAYDFNDDAESWRLTNGDC